MRAVVLVGGFGTRLRPLTSATPKQMLPIVQRPMIEHVVAWLGGHGVDEVVLSLGFAPDAFTDAYPNGRCGDMPLHYAVEPEPLDTGGAIRFAADHAGVNDDDRFLVVNGDVLTDIDITELVALHDRTDAAATIALSPVDDPSRYGVVPTDAEHRVERFVEKPPPGEAPTNEINAGLYVFGPAALSRIPAGRRVSVERETFPALVADGSLYAEGSDAYWIDTGTPATYLQAQLDLLDGTRRPPYAIELEQDGIAAGATIAASATVVRSVIGAGAQVGSGSTITDSVLFPGAEVGEGVRVERSIIAAGAAVGDGAALSGYSIIGAGERVADGEQLHDHRRPNPS